MPCSPNPKWNGERAELAFFFQAASRDFGVSRPLGDSLPYDAILDPAGPSQSRRSPGAGKRGPPLWRVQVRSVSYRNRWGLYAVPICRGRDKRILTPADIDFLAVWVVPHDTWYIVPVRALRGRRGLWFAPHVRNSHARFERYKEAWQLFRPASQLFIM